MKNYQGNCNVSLITGIALMAVLVLIKEAKMHHGIGWFYLGKVGFWRKWMAIGEAYEFCDSQSTCTHFCTFVDYW